MGNSLNQQIQTRQLCAYALALHPNNMVLASGGKNSVKLWSTVTKELVAECSCIQLEFVYSLAFSADGTMLYCTSSGFYSMSCWRVPTYLKDAEERYISRRHPSVTALEKIWGQQKIQMQDDRICSIAVDAVGGIYADHCKRSNGSPTLRFRDDPSASADTALDISVAWDGSFVACGYKSGVAKIYDMSMFDVPKEDRDDDQFVYVVPGHSEAVCGIALSPRAPILLTASYDGSAILWDVSEILSRAWKTRSSSVARKLAHERRSTILHGNKVHKCAFSARGRLVVTSSEMFVLVSSASSGTELFRHTVRATNRTVRFPRRCTNVADAHSIFSLARPMRHFFRRTRPTYGTACS